MSVTLGRRAVSDFVHEAQARISREITMPPGTYALFSGENEARTQSQHDLLANGAMAAVGIVLLLSLAMKSRRSVLLVMANLPFALVGGALSVIVGGGNLSLGGMVGFVTLFGISLRNSIMLISHYEHLVYVDGLSWGTDTAIRGASERLVPSLGCQEAVCSTFEQPCYHEQKQIWAHPSAAHCWIFLRCEPF